MKMRKMKLTEEQKVFLVIVGTLAFAIIYYLVLVSI